MKRTSISFTDVGVQAELQRDQPHMTDERFRTICRLILAVIIGAVCIVALVKIGWIALVVEAALAFLCMAFKYCE